MKLFSLPKYTLAALAAVTGFAPAFNPYLDPYILEEEAILYQSAFDEPDALEQTGWSIDQGQASIVGDGLDGGCLRVEPSAEGKFGQVTFKLDPPPDLPVLFVDFYVKPVAFEEGPEEFADVAGSVTGAFQLVRKPEADLPTAALYVLNGNGDRGGDWMDTGVRFELDADGRPLHWMRLTFRQEFFQAGIEESRSRWDLWVDGRLVGMDMGYFDDLTIDPGRITLLGHRKIPLYLDQLTVSSENPLFVDRDRNGLADAYEEIYQLTGGRDDDGDEDGLVNGQEYLLGTNPTVADTDKDGLGDGEEYGAENRDPLDPKDASEIAAQSFTHTISDVDIRLSMGPCHTNLVSFNMNAYLGAGWEFVFLYGLEGRDQDGYPLSVFGPKTWTQNTYIYVYSPSRVLRSGLFYGTFFYRIKGATGSEGRTYWQTARVFFNCCSGCGADGCASYSSGSLGSLKFRYDLGSVDFGDQSAEVQLDVPEFTSAVYDRSSLLYFGPRDADRAGFSEISAENDSVKERLEWVKTDRQYTLFEDLPSGQGYQISMYALDALSPENTIVGEPFRRVYVFNPDGNAQGGIKRLRIVEEGDRNLSREYRYYELGAKGVWELYEGAPSSVIQRPLRYHRLSVEQEPTMTTGKQSLITRKRWETGHWDQKTASIVIDSVKDTRHRRFPFGSRKIEEILDPDGQALSTRYGYKESPELMDPRESAATIGEISRQWMERPDGYWEWYGYDKQSRMNRIVRPLGNQPRPETLPEAGPGYHVENRDFDGPGYRVRIVETKDGHVTKTTFNQWDDLDGEGEAIHREVVSYKANASMDDPDNQVTITKRDRSSNHITYSEDPAGRVTRHEYEVTGDERKQTTVSISPGGVEQNRQTIVTHRSGTITEHIAQDSPSGVLTRHTEVAGLDNLFRPTRTFDQLTGETTAQNYDCCDLSWQTGPTGATQIYERDALGRVIAERTGYKDPLEPDNVLSEELTHREYRLDGLDRRRETLTHSLDGGLPLRNEIAYNLAGQVTFRRDATQVQERSKMIMLSEGGRLELSSLPRSGEDKRHRITSEQYNAAGDLLRRRKYASADPFALEPDPGTLVSHQIYEKGRDEKGRYEQVTDSANLFDRRMTRTYFDEIGQKVEIVHAYATDLAASERFFHDEHGRIIQHVDPDGATTRYAYNDAGERTITAVDLNIEPGEAPGNIDFAVDRISRRTSKFTTNADGRDVRQTTTEAFTKDGPIVISIAEESLDGTYSSAWENDRRVIRERLAGTRPGHWSVVTTEADGSHTVQTYERGRLIRTANHASDGSVISWIGQDYDGHGRVAKITDSRTGTTTFHYDGLGRRWKVSAPNPQSGSSNVGTLDTLYRFDELGRIVTIIKPSGSEVHQVYNANGTLRAVRGHHTTDREYRYNGRGERIAMLTSYGAGNEPASTRWHFNARGQLAFKQDAAGNRVYYTHTPGGRIKERVWARGVRTRYHYDPANALDLRRIEYSDGTPAVHFTHTRMGQEKTITDAGGTTIFAYDGPSLASEFRASDSKLMTYSRDEFDRFAGFEVESTRTQEQDYAVTYRYDNAGRLEKINAQGYQFEYEYEPNSTSERVRTVRALFVKETGFVYERGRDAITSVTNRVGFTGERLLSRYDYTNDADGQRTARSVSVGEAGGYSEHYTYDPATGGVASSIRRVEGEPAAEDGRFLYGYDNSGNRQYARTGVTETVYEPNALNQYSAIESVTPVVPAYDRDGNLIRRGTRTYTWDGENRLTAIRERGALIAKYTYDHQGRRIARWTAAGIDERYLYQGWNLIAVYAGQDTQPRETYTWGKDISGSLEDAGGVGGLLFCEKRDRDEGAWIYHYDANGNVTEVTTPRGDLLDRYDYDPFGNLRNQSRLPENHYRFSTKRQDPESGIYYYGYRYYDPIDGRWLSRDPIEEAGGLNLYGFLDNDAVNAIDKYGLVKYRAIFGANFKIDNQMSGVYRDSAGYRRAYLIRDLIDEWASIYYNFEIVCSSSDVPILTKFYSSGTVYGGGSEISYVMVSIPQGTMGNLLSLTERHRKFFSSQRYLTLQQGMMDYEVIGAEVSIMVNAIAVADKRRRRPTIPFSATLGKVPIFGLAIKALSNAWNFINADPVNFSEKAALAFNLRGGCCGQEYYELETSPAVKNSGFLKAYANVIQE